MRYFTPKEILLGVASVCWLGLLGWLFLFSDKTFGDIAVNLVTDIWFAIFVVFFIEYANKKDREAQHKARRRAIALSVQRFYQRSIGVIQAIVADGVASSSFTVMPTREVIVQRAQALHGQTSVYADAQDQPTPYAAFFMSEFTGLTRAGVLPERTSNVWINQLASELEPLYRDVFFLDNGFLPDEVVDALTELKDFHLILFTRHMPVVQPVRIGFWPENDLNTVTTLTGVLQRYFAPQLDYSVGRSDEFLHNAIVSALLKKSRLT
jgi:hypothetical protein